MIAIVLVIAIASAIGVAAERRHGVGAVDAGQAAMVAVLYTIVPAVVFFNIARLELDVDLGAGVVLGYVALAASAGLAYLVARALGLTRPATGALLCCIVVVNTGFLGYPMTVAVLGLDSLGEAVVYDIAVNVPMFLLAGFAIGAAFGTKAGETVRDRVRAFFTRNPPLFAALAGLATPDALAPDPLLEASRVLVVAVLPVGFFVVGAALSMEARRGALQIPPPLRGPVATGILLRIAVAPGLLLAMSAPLIELPDAYLLLAAMPSAINCVVIAHIYGLDLRITSEIVLWTTLVVVAAGLASLAL